MRTLMLIAITIVSYTSAAHAQFKPELYWIYPAEECVVSSVDVNDKKEVWHLAFACPVTGLTRGIPVAKECSAPCKPWITAHVGDRVHCEESRVKYAPPYNYNEIVPPAVCTLERDATTTGQTQ